MNFLKLRITALQRERVTKVCLFLLLSLSIVGNLPEIVEATTYSTPYTPINYNVLIITSSYNTFHGSGLTNTDFARYGFNVTFVGVETIDFTTDERTSDLSQYDVVFIQGVYTGGSPAQVSESEIDHFVNYNGVLILNNAALLRNETDGSWWGLSSSTVQKIEARMGIDYIGYGGEMKNATMQRVNDSIVGLPANINCQFPNSSSYYPIQVNLNEASEIYNLTILDTSTQKGVTYYENATGAIGIYITYIYTFDSSGEMLGISTDNNILRAQMLHALIAFAKEQTFNTIISAQNMAMWRMDDPTSNPPYNDTLFLNALNYLYAGSVANPYDPDGTNYGIVPNIAYVEGTGGSYPNTLARMQELEREGKITIESHFGHEDYRTWSIAQINSQWDIDIAEWRTLGFNPFSYLIVPVGTADYETANMLSTMKNKGYYIMDLGLHMDYDWHINDTVIVRGVFNIGGESNFTQKSKASILDSYLGSRNLFALAVANGGANFYQHSNAYWDNECGIYWIYTVASNFTDQIGDVEWLAGYEWGLYAPSYKWATVSSPSQSGSTITFTLNVDNVPSIVTIGKGMIWLRIDTNDTIASITIDGSPWYVFDNYTIKVPASNSQIQVTLGTPTKPYIKESHRKITATSYISNKLSFTTNSLSGTTSRTEVYATDHTPIYITNTSFNLTRDFNETSKILNVSINHSSNETVTIGFRNSTSDPLQGNSILAIDDDIELMTVPTYNSSTKQFNLTINGSGTNKNLSLNISNISTDYFRIYDNNNLVLEWRSSSGVNKINSSYNLEYNSTTKIATITIPTMSEHDIILDGSSKSDGSSCSSNEECSGGYCVHNICRSSSTYCGDAYCDAGESCFSCVLDCGVCVGGGFPPEEKLPVEEEIFEEVLECPPCPQPTEWSECIDNKQSRTNYRCSVETNYICESYIEERDCEVEIPPVNIFYEYWYIGIVVVVIVIIILSKPFKFKKKLKLSSL